MGTPLPPNEPALACSSCWGPGKPFGNGNTPQVIEVHLVGILGGELGTDETEILLLTPHLLQRVQLFCTWEIINQGLLWRLVYSDQFTNLIVERISDGARAFTDTFPPTCQRTVQNDIQERTDNLGFAGHADISWDLEGLD